MGIYSRGRPTQRIILDGRRMTRAYQGERLAWSDVSAGVVGVGVARIAVVMRTPRVTPGYGAPAAVITVAVIAPTVSSHATVLAPRASISLAMHAPDAPKVAAAPPMAITLQMFPPTFIDAEDVSPPTMAIAVVMPMPVVGIAVAPPTMSLTAEMHAPMVSGSSLVAPTPAAVNAAVPVPGYAIAMQAERMVVAAALHVPGVAAEAVVAVPAAAASAAMPTPIAGIAVTPPTMTATVATSLPAITASSWPAAPAATVSVAARVPAIHADATVAAPVATVTVQARTPVVTGINFQSSGMTKNGSTYSLSSSMTEVPGWVADTTGYPGSTTSGNALVANGNGTGNISTSLTFTNGGITRTVTVQLKLAGVVVATSPGTSVPNAGGTITLTTASPIAITSGQLVTVEAQQSAGTIAVTAGAANYVRISPV